MSTSVVGAIGINLVRGKQQQSEQLLKSLDRSFIDDKPDWNYWRRTSTISTANTYVQVHTPGYDNGPATFYSKKTREFLKTKRHHLPIFTSFSYSSKYGLVYFNTSTSKKSGIKSKIWMRLSPVIDVLLKLMLGVVFVSLVCLTIGWFIISMLARRLTQPLTDLSQAAKIQSNEDKTDVTLPVPQSPIEVSRLAESFNTLLTKINDKNKQERAFISNAAHELRTPIAAIKGHAQLVQRRGKDHPELINRSIDFIAQESFRMQTLVNELLELSRADREQVQLSYLNLADVVYKVIEEEQTTMKQKLIMQGDFDFAVLANEDNVRQILVALLDNAKKYSAKGTTITVKANQNQGRATLSVADQGPGIPDSEKGKVFDRFYRSDQAHNSQIQGTGLGLSIVRQLALLNDIEVSITDELPHGTCFNLIFSKLDKE